MVDPGNEDSVQDILLRNRDDFDNAASLNFDNKADLPSHYPFNPERHRLFVNGSRKFVQYNSVAELNDTVDSYEITPQNSGDVVTFKTAERYRYVVQYVIEWSLALQLNQELQSGEILAVGFGDPDLENTTDNKPGPGADGWIVYQNGSDAADEATLAEYRNGTEKDATTLQLSNLFQTYGRLGGRTNWYNVGPTTVEETFTSDGTQLNDEKGRVSVDDGKGPETANKNLTVSLKAKGGAGNLTADIGSMGARTIGDTDGIVRPKQAQIEDVSVGTTGSFVPLAALRVDPNNEIVTVNFVNITPTSYGGSGELKLAAIACDPSKTDASNFSAPPEQSATSSVIQQTTNVSEMPNASGTQTANPSDPGGHQLGFGTLQSNQQSAGTTSGIKLQRKQLIANSDEVIMAAFVPSSGATGELTFEYSVEQDW